MTATTAIRATTRTLHLVDIENLCGGSDASAGEMCAAFDAYLEAARWQVGDLVYVACHPALAPRFVWCLPVECNVRTANGQDGADLALLAQAAPEFVARRAGRLVIGSGDGDFIARAVAARELGVGVLVVARPDATNSGWRAHGFPVRPLVAPLRDAA